MERNKSDLKLIYVLKSMSNLDGSEEYDFYFSENPEVAWGVDWDIDNPSSCSDLRPEPSTYSEVKRVNFDFKMKTIEEISCYSMEYAIYGMIALAWTDLDGLDEYPEKGRCVFHFCDSYEKVKEICEKFSLSLD